jgi:polar amino acid transport system permease protein
MDAGAIVEEGTPEQVLDHPSHERTQRFLSLVQARDLGGEIQE